MAKYSLSDETEDRRGSLKTGEVTLTGFNVNTNPSSDMDSKCENSENNFKNNPPLTHQHSNGNLSLNSQNIEGKENRSNSCTCSEKGNFIYYSWLYLITPRFLSAIFG